ncbi:hypothetical protein Z517_02182 [Fonsecaea pedrosoi CBS 271.37]|uniref:Uncharacterized protein n=1 Tax=Fonsecaea pedrosoi CBS 271.37 TaxID=1442368 RepID=A0A0D2HER9_9EURO|nr:uncharacterized protein Z517_02182 [Fonsecaea pedrosoi CBS 271.37]KIW82939.1 hypothetical protein Z517_02182 [Fonsecaea pedrosoi CBS 271.37]
MASNGDLIELKLDGVVRYTLRTTDTGDTIIDAKWISTRTLATGQTGTGRAVRRKTTTTTPEESSSGKSGFEGAWTIEYYGPDGNLAVTPFLLDLVKKGEIYHGKWADPKGRPLLEGFGFEDDGKLYMRYGDRWV